MDWLAAAGQTWWQVLPLGPPDRHHSPYKARSAFAAWPGLLADRRASVSAAELERVPSSATPAGWRTGSASPAGAPWPTRSGSSASGTRFAGMPASAGVRLFGDLAIYVAPDSADHRAHPELFQDGWVAGAPPDAFSSRGQLWGNPLYDWPALQRRRYRWWVRPGGSLAGAVRPGPD